MKSTCPSNGHCNTCGLSFFFFLHVGYQGAWGGSVVGMSESFVFAHRVTIDPSPVHEVFLLCCGPLAGVRVRFDVDQSSFTKALCLLQC